MGVADSLIVGTGSAKSTYENDFGSLIFCPPTTAGSAGSAAKSYAFWNGHDGAYGAYNNYLKVGSGLPAIT